MNSTNNDFYKNAALKVFAQLGQLIEEDENKPKQINVLDSSTVILKDDKPDDYKEYCKYISEIKIIKHIKNTILQKVVKLILIFYF